MHLLKTMGLFALAGLCALGALLLGGCASGEHKLPPLPIPFAKPTDTVSFDRVQLALAIGDFQALAAVLEAKAQERCAPGSPRPFTAQTCLQIQAAFDQAATARDVLVKSLKDPKVEIDWQEVARVAKLLISIAMKFV